MAERGVISAGNDGGLTLFRESGVLVGKFYRLHG